MTSLAQSLALASVGAVADRRLAFPELIGRINFACVPRGAVPRPLSMKNVGPAPNRIQGTASQVNQEVVTGGTFHTPSNLLVEQVLCEYPGKAAGRSHHKVNLPHSRHARFLCTGPGSVLVPGRAGARPIFFDGKLAERSNVPLRTVGRIPQQPLKPAPPVCLGVRQLQLRSLRIILDLDVSRERALNGMAHVAIKQRVTIVPT